METTDRMKVWMEEIAEHAESANNAVNALVGEVLKVSGMDSELGQLAIRALNSTLWVNVQAARRVDDITAIAEMEA
jgi:ribosomal protein S28E/S33